MESKRMDRHISALEDDAVEEQPELPLEDAGDAAKVKAKIRASKLTDQRRKEVLRHFLATREGRLWFFEFLGECGCFRNPYSSDSGLMAFSCGEMNVGQRVLAEIVEVSPQAYFEMLRESSDGT